MASCGFVARYAREPVRGAQVLKLESAFFQHTKTRLPAKQIPHVLRPLRLRLIPEAPTLARQGSEPHLLPGRISRTTGGYLYIWIGGLLVGLGILAYVGRAILEAYERGRVGLTVFLGFMTLGLLFGFARTLRSVHRSIRLAQDEHRPKGAR